MHQSSLSGNGNNAGTLYQIGRGFKYNGNMYLEEIIRPATPRINQAFPRKSKNAKKHIQYIDRSILS